MKKKIPSLLLWLYLYGALQIGGLFVWGSMNDNESWAGAFHWSYILLFLPLNVLEYLQMQLFWGTTQIFEVRPILGFMTDLVLMSVVSTHLFYFAIRLTQRALGTQKSRIAHG